RMDDVSDVDAEVGLTDLEADGLAMEVVVAVGVEEACAVEVATVLVSRGIGEAVVVMEVDALT
ncbi:hypothetical protein KI387_001353, partial [Taxus chinensis]